jgi:hypothetical protein
MLANVGLAVLCNVLLARVHAAQLLAVESLCRASIGKEGVSGPVAADCAN